MDKKSIQAPVARWANRAGFQKRSDTWYRRFPDLVQVLNLQKSQYGDQYYLNVGIYVPSIGAANSQWPKEHQCHVRARAKTLVSEQSNDIARFESAMDLEDGSVSSDAREQEIERLLDEHVASFFDSAANLEDLHSLIRSGGLNKALVHRELKE
jgi:hypothetical protein